MKTSFFYSFCLMSIILVSLTNCNKTTDKQKTNSVKETVVDRTDLTNDFYDNSETFNLPLSPLSVTGEIANPSNIDLSTLPLHSVIVKEAVLNEDGTKFIGAYKYDGYSLYDILNLMKLKKANEKEFNPIIDLYVTIENSKGEKVIISWGEIYYAYHLHEIIIAKQITRIVPSKTKKLWALPTESKLIVSTDLITERNISMPSKITVKSYHKSFFTRKGLVPLYSPKIDIYANNKLVNTLKGLSDTLKRQEYPNIFYGRGRGFHSATPFNGVMLKDILSSNAELSQKNIRTGTFLVVAKDGYRGLFSYSEIFNRNDQNQILLICNPKVTNDGIFRLFPACDFFSDRAIKGISDIYFSNNEN